MGNPKAIIVMGSENDMPVMEEAAKALAELGVPCRMHVASAHRTPEKAAKIASGAKGAGVKVIIAGAGYAAHLAGAMAANTTLPIIGVPLDASSLSGLDSLLSTVQMPAGLPVATVSIGKTGAKNAGILAAQIIALSDEAVAGRLAEFRRRMADKVEEADRKISS